MAVQHSDLVTERSNQCYLSAYSAGFKEESPFSGRREGSFRILFPAKEVKKPTVLAPPLSELSRSD